MKTEHWALIIAGISLLGTFWQWYTTKNDKADRRRTELLQQIKNVELIIYSIIQKFHIEMMEYTRDNDIDQDLSDRINACIPNLEEMYSNAENLGKHWSDYNNKASVRDIEAQMVNVQDVLITLTSMRELTDWVDSLKK